MTLTNPKPLGWAYGERLTSAQMNSIGSQLPYAVDGNAGGTYAPSAPIIIGGSGVTLTGGINGSVAVATNVTAGGNITAGTVSAATLASTGALTVATTAAITGSLLSNRLRFTTAVGPDANTTLTIGTSAQIIVATNLTADRTYMINDASVQDGDWFIIQNLDVAQSIAITSQSAGTPITASSISALQSAFIYRVAGAWQYMVITSAF